MVAQAESIGAPPISRTKFLAAFGLEGQPGQRLDGSVRGRRMSFTETWEHASGLTITAYDSEYLGAIEITTGSIDHLLNPPRGRKASDFIGDPGIGDPRKTFEGFTVLQGDKPVFRSNRNQGEQNVDPNS